MEINKLTKQSFFNVCSFKKEFNPSDNVQYFEHNLNYWNILMNSIPYIKNNVWVINITYPFSLEFKFVIEEKLKDDDFFFEPVAKLKLIFEKSSGWYLVPSSVQLKFSSNCKYLLFDTPHIYPHNKYIPTNHKYLVNKINNSILYLERFIKDYNQRFHKQIPFMFIKSTREDVSTYYITIIITSKINITFIKKDDTIDNCKIVCNIHINEKKKKKSKPINIPNNPNNVEIVSSNDSIPKFPSLQIFPIGHSSSIANSNSNDHDEENKNDSITFHEIILAIPRIKNDILINNITFEFSNSSS